MKMSLTPDRLKTMEIYKQEKAQRGAKKPPAVSFKPEADAQPIVPSRTSSSRPSLRRVDSIIEDEEESPKPHSNRPRQGSHAASTSQHSDMSVMAMNGARTRSISTSGAAAHSLPRKSSKHLNGNVPSSFSNKAAALTGSSSASNLKSSYAQNAGRPMGMGMSDNGMPTRTRVKQRNRESLDLDDIMGGSDDDDIPSEAPTPQRRMPATPTSPASTTTTGRRPTVSAATRDLMDFLADGPPEPRGPPVTREGKQLLDFLNEGPPNYAPAPAVSSGDGNSSKSRAGGRLQRMISKLNIGDKAKATASDPPLKTPIHQQTPGRVPGAPIPVNPLGSLANRPIPPRPPKPPQPISPPDSPTQRSLDEGSKQLPPRKVSVSHERKISGDYRSATPSPLATQAHLPIHAKELSSPRLVPYANGNGTADYNKEVATPDAHHVAPMRSPTIQRKPVPAVAAPLSPPTTHQAPAKTRSSPPPVAARPSAPAISHDEARDMQRLIANATTAEECRLIVDMFLTRAGIPRVEPNLQQQHSKLPSENDGPYPSPPPSMNKYPISPTDAVIENSVVDMLLGQSGTQTPPIRPPRRRTAKSPEAHYEEREASTPPEERMDRTTVPITRKPAPEYIHQNGHHQNGHIGVSVGV